MGTDFDPLIRRAASGRRAGRSRPGIWRVWLCLLLGACGEPGSPTPSGPLPSSGQPPLLVIGVDGLEWEVLLPLLEAGRLPHLAQLIERGTYGLLATFQPTLSPVIWTTIATGKPHEEHGIHGFTIENAGAAQRPYASSDRRTKAIWNIAADHGKRVASIGWWTSWPAEPIEGGVVVTQAHSLDQQSAPDADRVWKGALLPDRPGQVHPLERRDELMAFLPRARESLPALIDSAFGGFDPQPDSLEARLWKHSLWSLEADLTYASIAEHLLAQGAYDLTLVYLGSPDVLGHRFWRYRAPELYREKPSASQIEACGRLIDQDVIWIDSLIGRLVASAGPGARIFVLSDHGMRPTRLEASFEDDGVLGEVNSAHHLDAPPGVLIAAGPGVRAKDSAAWRSTSPTRAGLETTGSVFDVLPSLLCLLDIPAGRDMRGRVVEPWLALDFLREHPPRRVATHDTPDWQAGRAQAYLELPDVRERLQQLRDLGYLGD